MKNALQLIRSMIFNVLLYVSILVVGVVFLPWTIVSRRGAMAAAHTWAATVIWMVRVIVGLRVEIRGNPPTDEVLVAAKHQSFLDAIVIYHAMPHAKFIMKHLLIWTPIVGQYTLRLGFVPVNRGKRGQAIKKMIEDVKSGRAEPGQLVIYPQGTRVAPGEKRPYKVGTGVLYRDLAQDCVPVATNAGCFWPKRGFMRRPGTVVFDFMPRIPAGMPVEEFMKRVENQIETRSETLAADAMAAK